MAKKDKKRSAEEAGLVAVEAGATSAAGVGLPTANEGEMALDASVVANGSEQPSKKKKKSSKKDKDGAAAAAASGAADKSSSKKEKEKELEIPAEALSPIAHPLAGKKLSKKVLKTVKKGECV